MQSGTAYSTWALNGRRWYVEGSKQIAMELGCTTEMQWKERNFTELLSCLQKVELNALLAAVLVSLFKVNAFFYLICLCACFV